MNYIPEYESDQETSHVGVNSPKKYNSKNWIFVEKFDNAYIASQAIDKNQYHLTYKLIWQGYPVLICGTSDRDRHFHPFG